VGVATQDPLLRKRFKGEPEHLVNFMLFVAQEVREIMAELGFRSFCDMIGQTHYLEKIQNLSFTEKQQGIDFSRLFHRAGTSGNGAVRFMRSRDEDMRNSIDPVLIQKAAASLDSKKHVEIVMPVRNSDRAVGALLSSHISRKYGSAGLPDGTIHCKFTGSAGQSFAAFLTNGVFFELEGDANDHFCKGLCGGRVCVYPPRGSTFRSQNNIIAGNVNLYGATSGEAYINGMAGERFAVRNSGAVAVVEGVGDHGCEYMTGGTVVVLGRTGINFAAGMSGGVAYILDEDQLFDTTCNLEMVDVEPVIEQNDHDLLQALIANHVTYTGSEFARRILHDWTGMVPLFVKVMPIEYKKALERIRLQNMKEQQVTILTEEVW